MASECNGFWEVRRVKMRENGFPRDRHYKSTRDKKRRERDKAGFMQDFGVLRGFRAGFSFGYTYSAFFVPQCNRLKWGLIGKKGANKRLSERQFDLGRALFKEY
jgi:hypothetical protein